MNESTCDIFETGDDAELTKQIQNLKEKVKKIHNSVCWTLSKAEVVQ